MKESHHKNHITPDTIIGIVAVILALFALYISIQQGEETRRYNRLSIRPVLNFETKVAEDDTVETIYLRNFGTGPAIIKNFTICFDGQPVEKVGNDPWGIVTKNLNEADIQYRYFWYSAGDVIGTNEKNSILSIREEDYEKSNNKQAWAKAVSGIKIIINYNSIYDEAFVVSYEAGRSPK